MKKIFYLAAMAIATIFVSSCKDDPDVKPQTKILSARPDTTAVDSSSMADYTFVMIATGGGDLDHDITSENLISLQKIAATNGKVRLVGIYKPSYKCQSALGENGGTRFFELKMKEGITKEKVAADVKAIDNAESNWELLSDQLFFNDVVNEKYAGADYKLYTPDNIATMLKFLTQKAPAKKYILVTEDHGGGWTFTTDVPLSVSTKTTRAMVTDDCLKQRSICLDEFSAGVKHSGIKFDALFCNLCLMGTLENLYAYSENFPICLASAESTTVSLIGNLAERLARIGGNATHDQLFSECSDWATTTDTNTGHIEWYTTSTLKSRDKLKFQSMGCYDLTKIGTLTSSLTAISNWFTNAMADEQLKNVVDKSVLTTLYTTLTVQKEDSCLLRDKYIAEIGKYNGYEAMTADQMADLIIAGKSAKLYKDIDATNDHLLWNFHDQQQFMKFGYPMAYFVWNTERIAKQKGLTKEASELSSLLDNYTTALKGMCRIKCSFDDFGGITAGGVTYPKMDPYIWTSPTVQIAALDTNSFNKNHIIDYSPWKTIISADQAIAFYNNTKFDQQTGWSNFLKRLDHNPNVFTNTFREIPVYYKVFGSLK